VWSFHQVATVAPHEDPCREVIPPTNFAAQLSYLRVRGFRAVGLDEVVDERVDGTRPKGREIALTFDDGYLDTYAEAFPLLQRHCFSATVFLVVNRVGKRRDWGLGPPVDLMGWEHINEMARFGFSFQSHTCGHPDLTELGAIALRNELFESKARLEEKVQCEVRYLAYPYGRYNERVLDCAREAGYAAAYGTDNAGGGAYCRQRLSPQASDPSLKFAVKASPWASWVRSLIRR
jgi:peptidoglycan/xylan/chitin deacetylase (PgdA/CDA1 family)